MTAPTIPAEVIPPLSLPDLIVRLNNEHSKGVHHQGRSTRCPRWRASMGSKT
jgi:hypothetical protein